METNTQADQLEQAAGHYRTAGNGLLLLGTINCAVGLAALTFGAENSYIAYDMMAVFGLSFVGVGIYMRRQATAS